jgi:hexosaminidase
MKASTIRFVYYTLIILLVTASQLTVFAQPTISVIPTPVSIEIQRGEYRLSSTSTIGVVSKDASVIHVAQYFNAEQKSATGFDLKVTTDANASIQLQIITKRDNLIGDEGYYLQVTNDGVLLRANKPAGLFYGIQTLLQLLPKEIESKNIVNNLTWSIPAVSITDYPRFVWRGMMLDVSRHFFPVSYIKTYIDQLARYKINRFHWHLTDDNGWRIEIKSYPKLTSVGAWRVERAGTFNYREDPRDDEPTTYGGFYTQAEIKEIVQYAKDRFIEIMPEIDVPGHSMSILAAYPELSVTKDKNVKVNPGTAFSTWHSDGTFTMHVDNTLNPTDEKVYQFLDKVFGEVAALFPFEYIHMGGDECYKGYWEKDAGVQAFMKKNKINNVHELQGYFGKRVAKIITSKKKKVMGWDEILEGGIPANAAVLSWQGVKGGIAASRLKHPTVMSPNPEYYLDMMQGNDQIEAPVYRAIRLKQVYEFEVVPEGADAAYILGGQGNLWTEQIATPAHVEYMRYPRALAISESVWSPASRKDWPNFVKRVEQHFERFDIAKIHYATSMYDPIVKVVNSDNLLIKLTTEVPNIDIHYTLDNTLPSIYAPVYSNEILFPKGAEKIRIQTFRKGKPLGHLITLTKDELLKMAN